jgi:hypothetical protein
VAEADGKDGRADGDDRDGSAMVEDSDLERCFICGRNAESREHVIPKWLQRRFDLWGQRLRLPNKTSIPYSKIMVPACRRCNSEIYGRLEKEVREHRAGESEIWRWASKIAYALEYKDKFLAWDRKHPHAKIGDIINREDPLEMNRHLLHCVSGDFLCYPDPFGSVFEFRFANPQPFLFCHLYNPNSICISLGSVGYVVIISDGQALKRDPGFLDFYRGFPRPPSKEDMLYFYANCAEQFHRHIVTQPYVYFDPGSAGKSIDVAYVTSDLSVLHLGAKPCIVAPGPVKVHAAEPVNEDRLQNLCAHLGLRWSPPSKR